MTSLASRTRSIRTDGVSLDGGDHFTKREWLALGVMCFTVLLISLDQTVLNVALPTLVRDLHPTSSGLQWIADGYTLTTAVFLLFGGALGDRFGRRRLFLIGVAVFGGGSLGCALVHSTGPLIATRCRHGLRRSLAHAGHAGHYRLDIFGASAGPGHRYMGRSRRHRCRGRSALRRVAPATLLVGFGLSDQCAGGCSGLCRGNLRPQRKSRVRTPESRSRGSDPVVSGAHGTHLWVHRDVDRWLGITTGRGGFDPRGGPVVGVHRVGRPPEQPVPRSQALQESHFFLGLGCGHRGLLRHVRR